MFHLLQPKVLVALDLGLAWLLYLYTLLQGNVGAPGPKGARGSAGPPVSTIHVSVESPQSQRWEEMRPGKLPVRV